MRKAAVTLDHLKRELETVKIRNCGLRVFSHEGLTESIEGPCILLVTVHDSAKEYSEEILEKCRRMDRSELENMAVLLPEKDNERGQGIRTVVRENLRNQLGISDRFCIFF